MTVKELREALGAYGPERDGDTVAVWLPGSRIDLGSMILKAPEAKRQGFPAELVIEGNIREGSVLCD